MKKILSSRKGEMYIEAIVSYIILIAFLVFALGSFRVGVIKATADTVADQLLETACFYGCFGTEFQEQVDHLRETYPGLNFTVEYDAEWHNVALKRVKHGGTITITVNYEYVLKGFGASIVIPLHTTRTGASENFWKDSGS